VNAAICAALQSVYDPCSQAWSRPLSLFDLGLVRRAELDDGHARVTLSLTAPFCMAIATIMQATELRVAELPGVCDVTVEIDTTTPWSPALMTEHGRRWLELHRSGDRARALPIVS
jgi:metal-sulfur cluster biosynthetic enzyme